MGDFLHLLPILFVVLLFAGMIGLLFWSAHSEKKWAKVHKPIYPADKVERIARAICAATGRNPDGDSGRAWKFHKDEAARFIAASEALAEPKIPHRGGSHGH